MLHMPLGLNKIYAYALAAKTSTFQQFLRVFLIYSSKDNEGGPHFFRFFIRIDTLYSLDNVKKINKFIERLPQVSTFLHSHEHVIGPLTRNFDLFSIIHLYTTYKLINVFLI